MNAVKNLFKTLWPFLCMGFKRLTATKPLQGGSLLFTTKFPEIPGTHLIDLGRMNGQASTVVTKLTKADLQSLPFFVFIFKIRFNGMQVKQKSLKVCITWKVVGFLELYIFPGYKNINK